MNKEKIPRQKHCSLLIALCSLLIALCSLLFSCPDPFSFPIPENIPDGKGSFTLSITVGRTILPKLDQDDFQSYKLVFTKSGGTLPTVDRTPANITDPVYLDEGTYSLVVTAFIDNKLVAQGSATGIVISLGSNTPGNITLRAINDGTGTGTFKYTVNFPAGLKKAEMTVTPLGAGSSEQNADFLSGGDTATATDTLTLPTGYYNVVFTFEREVDSQIMELVWREILHIYGNLESNFTETFTSNDFYMTHYAVTFEYNNGDAQGKKSVRYGGTVARPSESDNPVRPGYIFEGWYTSNDTSAPKFDFTQTITSNTTVYAKWIEITLPITNVEHILPYLAVQNGGVSVTNPVELSFELGLGDMTSATGGWQLILTELSKQTKYVDLDLSLCAMSGDVFDPYYQSNDPLANGKNKIVSIALPDAAISIGGGNPDSWVGAFDGFNNLKSFSGTGLKTIGNFAFFFCSSLTLISLPAGVTSIGSNAFQNCSSLALDSLPNSLETIGDQAFANCSSLVLASLPNLLKTIGDQAFSNCRNIVLTSLPSNITSIGNGAFSGCTGLTTISWSSSVTTISNNAFSGCTNLTTITMPDEVTSIGTYAFNGCTKLNLLSLPEDLTSIGNNAFLGCTSLTLISLPAGVTSIGSNAFQNCTNLKLDSLPAVLSSIGDSAFSNCTSLTTITINRADPPTAGQTIFGTGNSLSSTLRIEVPAGSVDTYKGFSGWNTYATPTNRIFAIGGSGSTAVGSSDAPFLISSEAQLREVGKNTNGNGWTLDKHYRLEADIPLSGNWTPIGTYVEDDPSKSFTGNFDGNGKSITGLTIDAPNANFQGMFGYIGTGGKVQNLTLNCTVSGKDYVGSVAGYNEGIVENFYNTGNVIGSADVGGVVGVNEGTVETCYSTGNISSRDASGLGGVVGSNYGTVKNCYATGNISASVGAEGYVGGVVGYNDEGTVQNCYATGNVSGTENVAGVVGGNLDGTVRNCYATGNVSGSDNVGGVVGYNDGGTVRNCVGLNGQITIIGNISQKDYGRVVGYTYGNNTLSNNYAWSDMTPPSGGNFPANTSSATGKNGANVTTAEAVTESWWTATSRWSTTGGASAWDFTNTWNPPSGSTLPTLKNMPTGTQNPMVQN